ncbi:MULTISPECIES: glycosyltransferase family 10 domain-containing protein [unclassified Luteimonas]
MKRVFFAGDMTSTPFQRGHRRDKLKLPQDIIIVDAAEDADVFVGRFLYDVAGFFHFNRTYYLWTHEPSWLLAGGKTIRDLTSGREVHVSTAWNGDIYLDPLFFFPFAQFEPVRAKELAKGKSEFCSILATYRKYNDRYRHGVNVDLTEYRQRLAMDLQGKFKACHVFGKNWPNSVALEGESRAGAWHDAKLEALQVYAFNLSLENTIIENYVTEKIWDSFRVGCVPVYYGTGSGVESVVSKDSYINCANFSSVEDLFEHMRSMTLDDRLRIMESAYSDIEKIHRTASKSRISAAIIDIFVSRIRQI